MIPFSTQLNALFHPYRDLPRDKAQARLSSSLQALFMTWFQDPNLDVTSEKLYRALALSLHSDHDISDAKLNGVVILNAQLLSEINAYLAPDTLCRIMIETYKATVELNHPALDQVDQSKITAMDIHVLIQQLHQDYCRSRSPYFSFSNSTYGILGFILFSNPNGLRQQFDLLWGLFSDDPEPKIFSDLYLSPSQIQFIHTLNKSWIRDHLQWMLTHPSLDRGNIPYWPAYYLTRGVEIFNKLTNSTHWFKVQILPDSYKKWMVKGPFYLTLAALFSTLLSSVVGKIVLSFCYAGTISLVMLIAQAVFDNYLESLSRLSGQKKIPAWSHDLPAWQKDFFNRILWPLWRIMSSHVDSHYTGSKKIGLQLAYPLRVIAGIFLSLGTAAGFLTERLICHSIEIAINTYFKMANFTYEFSQKKAAPVPAATSPAEEDAAWLEERRMVLFRADGGHASFIHPKPVSTSRNKPRPLN